MKKLTLSIGLVAAMLSTKAQDTICTYFKGNEVFEFNYQTNEITKEHFQTSKFYSIVVKDNEILCLDLVDEKQRVRKVITNYSDGESTTQILNSKDNTYFSPLGPLTILIGKPYLIILQ